MHKCSVIKIQNLFACKTTVSKGFPFCDFQSLHELDTERVESKEVYDSLDELDLRDLANPVVAAIQSLATVPPATEPCKYYISIHFFLTCVSLRQLFRHFDIISSQFQLLVKVISFCGVDSFDFHLVFLGKPSWATMIQRL